MKQLKHENLVPRAAEALRHLVLSDLRDSGAILPSQGELCTRLGVSRTVVREAMRMLEAEGLVKISQGKLPEVLAASPRAAINGLSTLMERSSLSLLDVLEVRRPLEVEAAMLAAAKATEEHLLRMHQANEALAAARTIEEQIIADMSFHKAVADATGNPVFGLLLDVLGQFLFESRRTTLKQSGARVALRHHQLLLAAIVERDISKARQAAEDGMRQTEADLKREARQSAKPRDPR